MFSKFGAKLRNKIGNTTISHLKKAKKREKPRFFVVVDVNIQRRNAIWLRLI